ncbi:MAG TPA: VOC family protein [Pseudorhizobium sp.]|nr:VOC family protein [Pseudorhizobium sp.]
MDLLNHIEFSVGDGERSRCFYEAALAPLGLSLVITIGPSKTPLGGVRHGFGRGGRPSVWFHELGGANSGTRIHVAFTAGSRRDVDAFYAAALSNGGRDNGPPGVRERYHSTYYAAYVLDPDGNNIEAVCETEE